MLLKSVVLLWSLLMWQQVAPVTTNPAGKAAKLDSWWKACDEQRWRTSFSSDNNLLYFDPSLVIHLWDQIFHKDFTKDTRTEGSITIDIIYGFLVFVKSILLSCQLWIPREVEGGWDRVRARSFLSPFLLHCTEQWGTKPCLPRWCCIFCLMSWRHLLFIFSFFFLTE